MDWIVNLFTNTESVAHIALLYAIVIAIGVYLGKLKIGGISLGVTFVLFAGILAGLVGSTKTRSIGNRAIECTYHHRQVVRVARVEEEIIATKHHEDVE